MAVASRNNTWVWYCGLLSTHLTDIASVCAQYYNLDAVLCIFVCRECLVAYTSWQCVFRYSLVVIAVLSIRHASSICQCVSLSLCRLVLYSKSCPVNCSMFAASAYYTSTRSVVLSRLHGVTNSESYCKFLSQLNALVRLLCSEALLVLSSHRSSCLLCN